MDQFNNEFASHWDELVGWEKRSDVDVSFLLKLLKKFGCKNILDVALGTGFHAINFLQTKFSVTGADVSQAMITIAEKNAARHGVTFDTICADWVNLKDKISQKYDCIICLGNSLACENDAEKRQLAVYNWSEILNEDGIIIIDRRNYEALLSGEYAVNSKNQYFGETVKITPDKVAEDGTVFSYTFSDGKVFKLHMYPISDDHIKSLFDNVGFVPVELYGDRELNFQESEVAFYHYVFKRNKNARV